MKCIETNGVNRLILPHLWNGLINTAVTNHTIGFYALHLNVSSVGVQPINHLLGIVFHCIQMECLISYLPVSVALLTKKTRCL